jgi:hypothetical protein
VNGNGEIEMEPCRCRTCVPAARRAGNTSGFRTFEDLRLREMTAGATGQTDEAVQIAKGMNAFLGTKLKTVAGYPGGNEINLAIERGEIDGRRALSWSSVKVTHPAWLEQKTIMGIPFTHVASRAGLDRWRQ